jgi:hypothetical protein
LTPQLPFLYLPSNPNICIIGNSGFLKFNSANSFSSSIVFLSLLFCLKIKHVSILVAMEMYVEKDIFTIIIEPLIFYAGGHGGRGLTGEIGPQGKIKKKIL